MRVADIMQTAVRTVAGDTPVSELVVSLADAKVTGLPVVDARERGRRRVEHGPDCSAG